MAIVTREIGSAANGLVRFEVGMNDANLRLNKVRGINDSTEDAYVAVFKAGVLEGEATIPAGVTVEQNLPASIKLTTVPQPNPEEDGPISMGDIQIRTRWPA